MTYCNECNVYFGTREALQQHIQDSSKFHPHCRFCDKSFSSENGYNMHTASKHQKCCICNRTFNSQIELQAHYRDSSKHPTCRHCGDAFVDNEAYDQHLQVSHRLEECYGCARTFVSRDALQDHYRDSASHPTCYDCNRGFVNDHAYHQHRSAVHHLSRRRGNRQSPLYYSYNTYIVPSTYPSSAGSENTDNLEPVYVGGLPGDPTEDRGLPERISAFYDLLAPDTSETGLSSDSPEQLLLDGLGSLRLDSPPLEHQASDRFENSLSGELPAGEQSHIDGMDPVSSSSPNRSVASSPSHVELIPLSPAQPQIYKNLVSLIRENMSPDDYANLQELVDSINTSDRIAVLVHSHKFRVQFLTIVKGLRLSNCMRKTRDALGEDDKDIFTLVKGILDSKEEKEAVLRLRGDDAGGFMTLIQNFLDRDIWETSINKRCRVDFHRFLIKLSVASEKLPSGFVIRDVICLEKHARCGGRFADIFQARYQGPDSTPQMVALKRLRISVQTQHDREIRRQFFREALVWKTLQHPHILPFLGVDSESFNLFIGMVSPWMENGTILKYIENRGPSNVNVNKCLLEVALGLRYLHSKNVVHGDLHARNVLIDREEKVCIADFGLVGFVETSARTHTTSCSGGAERWMAPELLFPEKFGLGTTKRTPASDIYAFACVCIEVHTRSRPFSDVLTDAAVMMKVIDGERPSRPCNTPEISDHLWDLMQACWKERASDRPSIEDVVRYMEEWDYGSA